MEISELIQELLAEIISEQDTRDYLQEFLDLKENYEKVNYVENYLKKTGKIEILENLILESDGKDNKKSLQFSNEANKAFTEERDCYKSLRLFNTSLCYADPGSWVMGLHYANRSAVLFEIKQYNECLQSIQMARALHPNLPARLNERLSEREKQCQEQVPALASEPHNFTIAYNSHSSVPHISSCLLVKNSNDLGRQVCTSKDLSPGNLVAVENPFCTFLIPDMKYIRCANCLRENYFTMIPCPGCTDAMFCNETCLNEALTTFHNYECSVIGTIFYTFYKLHFITIRMILTTLNLFESIDDWMAFHNETKHVKYNAFTIDYSTNDRKEQLKAICGLVTNAEKRSDHNLFYQSVVTCIIRMFLLEKTPVKEMCKSEEHRTFLADRILNYLQISYCNTSDLALSQLKNNRDDEAIFGSALYSFRSLLNHSCAPNTMSIYQGKKLLLFVLRPVPKGGELRVFYDWNFSKKDRTYRRTFLETKYYFVCKCEACIYNYAPLEEAKKRLFSRSLI